MDEGEATGSMTRRQLLSMIGVSAGSAAMYQAMTSLGLAADSSYKGPVQLSGAPAGSSVLVLGAGIAGIVAAYELRKAGYRVQVLEYNNRAGGRNWTLRGGDRYTELGGFTQECKFDPGLYINPGPWRMPYHHSGMLELLQTPRRAARAFVQIELQRLPAQQPAPSAASRSASAKSRPTTRAMWRSCSQRWPTTRSSMAA